MPELPEVEIVKCALEPAMCGKEIERCEINIQGLRYVFAENFAGILSGAVCKSVTRRGKYMILYFDHDYALVWHLGMSGRVKIFDTKADYEPEKHDHILFYLKDGTVIVYNDARRFGFMDLMRADEIETARHFANMGPEPLGNHFYGQALYDVLKNKKAPIKAALLDQRVVAGVGNIYACEALYMAGINPRKSAQSLSRAKVEKLAAAIKDVLRKAIEAGGSSLKDYAHTDGSLGYFQHMFSVYNREGQACPDCTCDISRTKGIKRIVQTGRSTFYCSARQK
ncbi:MAG: bifunctional DNA-formamidopyrimidine glycosylase/DNA-(apurinic or apyrimidinic site) lyase [Alphaproteobacteria bacterium]